MGEHAFEAKEVATFEGKLGHALRQFRRGAVVLVEAPVGAWVRAAEQLSGASVHAVTMQLTALVLPSVGFAEVFRLRRALSRSLPGGVRLGQALWPLQAITQLGLVAEAAAALTDELHATANDDVAEDVKFDFDGDLSAFVRAGDLLSA